MFIESTFMKYGKGPGGLMGITLRPKTVAVWALSLHTISGLVKDVDDLSDNPSERDVVLHHKGEGMSRMKNDGADRLKIRHKLSTCKPLAKFKSTTSRFTEHCQWNSCK